MPHALTSWKEIAQYLGKGVRTVQRWEHLLGLPVRRPIGKEKGIVLACTDELDAWLSSTTVCRDRDPGFEFDRLRSMVSDLVAEYIVLRSELQRLLGIDNSTSGAVVETLPDRPPLVLETSTRMRLEKADLANTSEEAREMRSAETQPHERQSRVA